MERAIKYGDAIFETIRVSDGQIPLLEGHFARLKKSMVLLGYEVPDTWDIGFFKTAILSDSPHNARVRFTVARSAGGLYLPTNHAPQYTVQASEMASAIPDWPLKGVVAGVACRDRRERELLPILTFLAKIKSKLFQINLMALSNCSSLAGGIRGGRHG